MNRRQGVIAIVLLGYVVAIIVAGEYAILNGNYYLLVVVVVLGFMIRFVLALFSPRIAPKTRKWATGKP